MITLGPDTPLDPMRTMRMATYGVLLSGPSLHLWFNFLSRILPKRDLITTFKKMILGQTVYGPIVNCVFFSFNAALQGIVGGIYKCYDCIEKKKMKNQFVSFISFISF